MLTVDPARLPETAGARILDIGCGTGRHVRALAGGAALVVGLDRDARDLAEAARLSAAGAPPGAAAFLRADALSLPFADNAFDIVVCSEVLEHLVHYEKALDEICRVTRLDGTFVASVPRYGPEWLCWKLRGEYRRMEGGHVRIFRAGRLRREIEGRRMRFLERHWAHALHAPFWWLKCLLWRRQDTSHLIAAYHRLLVWDMMRKPWITRALDRLLNPLIGKSVVLYFRKEDAR